MRRSSVSVGPDEQPPAFDPHLVPREVAVGGLLGAPAARDVELGAVQRALDLLAVDEPLGKQRVSVGADVLERVVAAVQRVDPDLALADLDRERRVLGHVGRRRHVLPLRHRASLFH
jgi:hypothetical protein